MGAVATKPGLKMGSVFDIYLAADVRPLSELCLTQGRELCLSLPLTYSVPVKVSKSKKYGYIFLSPCLVSGSAVALIIFWINFWPPFFCKITNILLGKGHFLSVFYLTRCRATFSAPSFCLLVSIVSIIVLSTLG